MLWLWLSTGKKISGKEENRRHNLFILVIGLKNRAVFQADIGWIVYLCRRIDAIDTIDAMDAIGANRCYRCYRENGCKTKLMGIWPRIKRIR